MSSKSILDALTREGVLIDVSVRYWRAAKKLTPEDLGLDAERVTARLISLGHKRLLPREALQTFALIESRAHALVESASFPFLGGIGHYLPNSKLPEVTRRLEALEGEFETARADFLGRYSALRSEAVRDWKAAACKLTSEPERLVATIEAAFPRPEDIQRHFGFRTHLFQISVPEAALRLDLVEAGDQRAIVEARNRAAEQSTRRIHEDTRQFIGECVATLRKETAELCEEMLGSMRGGKTEGVHQKTLNRLLKFLDQFRELNFAGDGELERMLETARRELLTQTAGEYRDDEAARSRLVKGLGRLRDQARDLARQDATEIVERFGRLGARRFTLAA